jgi:hypothetical protein
VFFNRRGPNEAKVFANDHTTLYAGGQAIGTFVIRIQRDVHESLAHTLMSIMSRAKKRAMSTQCIDL